MSTKESSVKKLSKKESRQMVYEKLVTALSEFKTGIKDKKFESNLQKASKLFAEDMVKAAKAAEAKVKKAANRKEKKSSEENV